MGESQKAFIDYLDDEMEEVVRPGTTVEAVAGGFKFIEGPVWYPPENGLLFSDIPNSRIHLWTKSDGVRVWREPSFNANGNTLDREGRLVTCEHGSRLVTRTDKSGVRETIAAEYQGRKLNSPNDAVVTSDGSIWFTDPPYAIKPEQQEQEANYVFRLDSKTGELTPVLSDFSRPNGLCFSPDESILYVADADRAVAHIRKFHVESGGTLNEEGVFARIEPGIPDGMRVDSAGRLYSSAEDGVHIYRPDGRLIGRIRTPTTTANCGFGGVGGKTLFLTARDTLWRVALSVGPAVPIV